MNSTLETKPIKFYDHDLDGDVECGDEDESSCRNGIIGGMFRFEDGQNNETREGKSWNNKIKIHDINFSVVR